MPRSALFDATRPDFTPIYARLHDLPAVAADVLAEDTVLNRGTREGFASNADV